MNLSLPKRLVQFLVLTTPLQAMELVIDSTAEKADHSFCSEKPKYQKLNCESLKTYFEKARQENIAVDLAINNKTKDAKKDNLLPHVFEHLNQLKKLNLDDFNLDSHPKIIQFFVKALKKNTSLETLILNNSHNDSEEETLGAQNSIRLIEALKGNNTLQSLTISYNDIDRMDANGFWGACVEPFVRDMVVPLNGSAAMAKLIKSNNTLTTLDLSYNGIIDHLSVRSLLKALTTNRSIRHFSFEGNDVGPINVKLIMKLLVENATLTHLNLTRTALGIDGAKGIANGLKVNTTLINLQLGKNRFYFEGTCAIALSLKVNKSLVTLNLASNKINLKPNTVMMTKFNKDGVDVVTSEKFAAKKIYCDGVTALASCLLENTKLQQLDLSSNGISPQKAQLLQNQLQSAHVPVQIYVGNLENKAPVYKKNITNTELPSDYRETI